MKTVLCKDGKAIHFMYLYRLWKMFMLEKHYGAKIRKKACEVHRKFGEIPIIFLHVVQNTYIVQFAKTFFSLFFCGLYEIFLIWQSIEKLKNRK